MLIQPFDEDLRHRKILPFSSTYQKLFLDVKNYVEKRIGGITLYHIGSTAVADLRGKPMISIFAITEHQNLRQVQNDFETIGFHRRQVWVNVDDKPYVCGSVEVKGERYNINIHICHKCNSDFREALEFLSILANNSAARREYEAAKHRAHAVDPVNPHVYNKAKESVILELLNSYRS